MRSNPEFRADKMISGESPSLWEVIAVLIKRAHLSMVLTSIIVLILLVCFYVIHSQNANALPVSGAPESGHDHFPSAGVVDSICGP